MCNIKWYKLKTCLINITGSNKTNTLQVCLEKSALTTSMVFSLILTLSLFRIGFFRPVYICWRAWFERPSPSLKFLYSTMMKLDTVILYVRKFKKTHIDYVTLHLSSAKTRVFAISENSVKTCVFTFIKFSILLTFLSLERLF